MTEKRIYQRTLDISFGSDRDVTPKPPKPESLPNDFSTKFRPGHRFFLSSSCRFRLALLGQRYRLVKAPTSDIVTIEEVDIPRRSVRARLEASLLVETATNSLAQQSEERWLNTNTHIWLEFNDSRLPSPQAVESSKNSERLSGGYCLLVQNGDHSVEKAVYVPISSTGLTLAQLKRSRQIKYGEAPNQLWDVVHVGKKIKGSFYLIKPDGKQPLNPGADVIYFARGGFIVRTVPPLDRSKGHHWRKVLVYPKTLLLEKTAGGGVDEVFSENSELDFYNFSVTKCKFASKL